VPKMPKIDATPVPPRSQPPEGACDVPDPGDSEDAVQVASVKKAVTQKEALEDIQESRTRFGLFVILRTHVTTSDGNFGTFFTYFVRFIALMIILTQWLLAILLICEKIKLQVKQNISFCSNNAADGKIRVTIGFLAFLYFARTANKRLLDLFRDLEVQKKRDDVGQQYGLTSGVSRLRKYNSLDNFMHVGYSGFVYSIMLWVTYTEASVKDMLLNCLAFEFMMGIDNEFVSVYLELATWSMTHQWKFGSSHVRIVDLTQYIEYEGTDEKPCAENFSGVVNGFSWIFGILATLFPWLMVSYGPICKGL